jgi:hypothetical protein
MHNAELAAPSHHHTQFYPRGRVIGLRSIKSFALIRKTLAWRIVAPFGWSGIAMTAFLGAAILYFWYPETYFDALDFFGILVQPGKYPFIDLQVVFATVECWQKGIDVYTSNPCDPLGRLFDFSPLILRFSFLPSSEQTPIFGTLLDVLFILSLASFPGPKRACEWLVVAFATVSPPVVFALERCNTDVGLFLIVVAAAYLWTRGSIARAVGYSCIFVAGALKFYPWVLLVLAIRERIVGFLTVVAMSAAILAAFLAYFHPELALSVQNLPHDLYFREMFGASILPVGLPFALAPSLPRIILFNDTLMTSMLWVALTIASLWEVGKIVRWVAFRRAFVVLAPFHTALLLFGAVVMCGCFFAGLNTGYRGIYLLLVLPAFLELWRGAVDPLVRNFARRMAILVVLVMMSGFLTWMGPFAHQLRLHEPFEFVLIWLIRELAWWRSMAVFGAIILCFVLESPAAGLLRMRLRRRPSTVNGEGFP